MAPQARSNLEPGSPASPFGPARPGVNLEARRVPPRLLAPQAPITLSAGKPASLLGPAVTLEALEVPPRPLAPQARPHPWGPDLKPHLLTGKSRLACSPASPLGPTSRLRPLALAHLWRQQAPASPFTPGTCRAPRSPFGPEAPSGPDISSLTRRPQSAEKVSAHFGQRSSSRSRWFREFLTMVLMLSRTVARQDRKNATTRLPGSRATTPKVSRLPQDGSKPMAH